VARSGAGRRAVVLHPNQQGAPGTIRQAHNRLNKLTIVQRSAPLALELEVVTFTAGDQCTHTGHRAVPGLLGLGHPMPSNLLCISIRLSTSQTDIGLIVMHQTRIR